MKIQFSDSQRRNIASGALSPASPVLQIGDRVWFDGDPFDGPQDFITTLKKRGMLKGTTKRSRDNG